MSVPLRPPPPGYWALAPTLAQLRRELLFAYEAPASSYGTIADKRHQARKSDHRPDQRRYVRALDVPGAEHGGPPLRLLAMLRGCIGGVRGGEDRRLLTLNECAGRSSSSSDGAAKLGDRSALVMRRC